LFVVHSALAMDFSQTFRLLGLAAKCLPQLYEKLRFDDRKYIS